MKYGIILLGFLCMSPLNAYENETIIHHLENEIDRLDWVLQSYETDYLKGKRDGYCEIIYYIKRGPKEGD